MKEHIIYLVAANGFALIALYVIVWMKFKILKADFEMQVTDLEYDLKGQIQTLGKTVQEWNETRQHEIRVLQETTIKAHMGKWGELIIKSPDGKTVINEFKINKQ